MWVDQSSSLYLTSSNKAVFTFSVSSFLTVHQELDLPQDVTSRESLYSKMEPPDPQDHLNRKKIAIQHPVQRVRSAVIHKKGWGMQHVGGMQHF